MEFKWESARSVIEISSMPSGTAGLLLTGLAGAYGIAYDTDMMQNFGRDGGVRIGARVPTREVTVKGLIMRDYAVNRERLMRAFRSQTDGLVTFQGASGKIRKQRFWATSQPIFAGGENISFIISLEAEDPYYYSDEGNFVGSLIPIKSNCEFPLEILSPDEEGNKVWTFADFMPSTAVELLNNGDGDVGATFTIRATGTGVNPSIVNVVSGEFLKVTTTVNAGTKIVIDTRAGRKSVSITNTNGETYNAMPLLDVGSTFHQIRQGANVFKLEADNGLASLNCFVSFKTAYIDL